MTGPPDLVVKKASNSRSAFSGGHADAVVAHCDLNLAGLILSRPDHQFARPVPDRLHRFDPVVDGG